MKRLDEKKYTLTPKGQRLVVVAIAALVLVCLFAFLIIERDSSAEGIIMDDDFTFLVTNEDKKIVKVLDYDGNSPSVTIPLCTGPDDLYSVESIGENAFKKCTTLTHIYVGEGIKTIENNAFIGCSSLSVVVLPNSLTKIGKDPFKDCPIISELTIPISLDVNDAFSGCHTLTEVTFVAGNGKGHGYGPKESTPWNRSHDVLETVVFEEGVVSIGKNLLNGCSEITSVQLPSTLTTVHENAFRDCESFNSLIVPDSVTKLENTSFTGCSGINYLTIPVNLDVRAAFEGCSSLIKLTFTEGNGKGHGYDGNKDTPWFQSAENLEEVVFEEGIISIGKNLLWLCVAVTSIQLPESLQIIGDNSFRSCMELESIDLPNGLQIIGDNAFYADSALSSVIIPDSVTDLGKNAFGYCLFDELSIPISLDASHAFSACNTLKKVTFTAGDGKAFEYDNNKGTPWNQSGGILEIVKFEQGVSGIGKNLLNGCSNIQIIEIPDTVTMIGNNAFNGCDSLKEIHFGTGLNNLHHNAFPGFIFQDEKGTALPVSADVLRDSSFSGTPDRMVKQEE